tara:strand:- start:3 stop:212 length:210 start_codon:yes stop_codon:yes gene_type:complete
LNDVDFRISINALFDLLVKLNFITQKNKQNNPECQIIMRKVFEIMQDVNEHYFNIDKHLRVADEKKNVH